MLVHLRVQRPLGQRLLQLVQQAVGGKGALGIGPSQQLVKDGIWDNRLFASGHAMSPS
jgi:hypothetical protein